MPEPPPVLGRFFAVLAVLAGFTLVIVGIATQLMVVGVAGFVLACAGAYSLPGSSALWNRTW